MSSLDLSGFVTKPDTQDWLYGLSDTIQKNNLLDERKAERLQTQKDKEEATLSANAKFLQNTFDPKQHLTGSLYDPVTTQLMSKAYGQALQLAQQKVPLDQILMATQPLVNQINDYTQKSAMYNANKKQWLDNNKNLKGVNLDAVVKEADKRAFYDIDPKTGQPTLNVDKAKPDYNYYADVLKNSDNPDIFNNEGMNDYVKTSGRIVQDQTIKTRDANGKIHVIKADITAPSYMQSETDAQGAHIGFVPKYTTATEVDAPLLHTFKDDQGNDVKAPVRMVTDDVWKSMPDATRAKIIQETRQLIKNKPGINIDSPQAESLGKAIAYDELKNNSKDYSTFKRTDVNMQPLPPRVTVNVGGAQQPQTVDLYNGEGGVNEIVSNKAAEGNWTRMNSLPVSAQATLLKMARDQTNDKGLSISDVYLIKDSDGTIQLMQKDGDTPDVKTDHAIFPVDPLSLNIPVNVNVTKVGAGKTKTEAINKVIDTGSKGTSGKSYSIKGKAYTHSDLLKGGWTEDQINQAIKSGKIK